MFQISFFTLLVIEGTILSTTLAFRFLTRDCTISQWVVVYLIHRVRKVTQISIVAVLYAGSGYRVVAATWDRHVSHFTIFIE